MDEQGFSEEHEADFFSFRLTQFLGANDTAENIWAVSGAGAVLLLKCLECLRKAKQVLLSGQDTLPISPTHPTTSDRIESFEHLDFTVPEVHRTPFRNLRRNVIALIDSIWPKLRNYILMMYEDGLRPENDIDGFDL